MTTVAVSHNEKCKNQKGDITYQHIAIESMCDTRVIYMRRQFYWLMYTFLMFVTCLSSFVRINGGSLNFNPNCDTIFFLNGFNLITFCCLTF